MDNRNASPPRVFRVTFEPMGFSCLDRQGRPLLEIAAEHDIRIRSDCGGQGRCGKCLVAVHPAENLSSLTEAEERLLTADQIDAGFRLACQALPQGPVTVSIPENALDRADAIGKTDFEGHYASDPMVKRWVVSISPPRMSVSANAGPRDFIQHIHRNSEPMGFSFRDASVIRSLSRPEYYGGEITLVGHREKGITAVVQGRKERSLGVALDIGTTTLAAYLCALESGTLLASAASANPQRRFGEDVISRITHASEHPAGLDMLQRSVIEEINALVGRCLGRAGADRSDVDEVAVVGNTTMQEIFLGIHPHGLGCAPYLPVTREPQNVRAEDVGLDLNPSTNVYVFPVISGFVGGDTMGVILSERPHEQEAVSLIVDIGTNGEVVLGNRDGLLATSCATGPALEGAHIDCGMRAAAGAIQRVSIDPKTFTIAYDVIRNDQDEPPRGICGSGIIDAIAGMLRAGIILPSGRIREGMPGVICDEKRIGRKYILVASNGTPPRREIGVTLGDVRQIQLAKSALFVGIKLLMKSAGRSRIDRLVLTGAFGARFDWKNAVAIGMLPEISNGTEVKVVPNAAGLGAIAALVDRKQREHLQTIAEQVRFIELAEDPDFQMEFAAATMFPEPTP